MKKKAPPPKKIGRNAEDGRFVTQDYVKKNPKTTINETIKIKPKKK
ncbi:MAG: hypothetical protein WC600_16995 [Desulfobaccales bacterium]